MPKLLQDYEVDEIVDALREVDYILADMWDVDEGPMPALIRALEILDPHPISEEDDEEEETD